MMIFQYYLDDATGAAVVGFVFLVGTTIGSLVSVKFSAVFSGMGVLAGAFISFTVVFFRIRYMLVHLDEHIYCRGNIVNTKAKRSIFKKRKEEQQKVVVYSFNK